MVDNCANPKCNKPLHYLRDGRVFTFNVPGASLGPNGQKLPRIEHYWLCGECSVSLTLEKLSEAGVQVLPMQMPTTYQTRPAIAS